MIYPPMVDLTKPDVVVKEIFDDDRWVKDEFAKQLSSEILEFGKVLAASFTRFPQIDALAKNDEQVAFVAGFVYGVFDDLLTSMKLLVTGKLMASGNLMRQAIEGSAVALLCSSRELVFVRPKNSKQDLIRICYWEHVKEDSDLAAAHKALKQLKLNCDSLGLSLDGINELKKLRDKYHEFSHPSMMGMASRMALGEAGPLFVGGSFDEAKLPAYKREIEARTGLCGALPNLIDALIVALKATKKAA